MDCRSGGLACRPMPRMMVGIVVLSVCACMSVQAARAEQEPRYELPEMVVTASRIPSSFSDLTRGVTVIDRRDIESGPAHTIQDVLRYAAGVDVRERSPLGVQADASIRGGTFEQTLVLIDGIKVSDPQTGHHNLNLPLTLDDVDRIEILRGHGSSLYGPNALGGVINIITRKRQGGAVGAEVSAGEFGLVGGTLSLSRLDDRWSHRVSVSGRRSGGYRDHTDSRTVTAFYQSALRTDLGGIALSLGHTDKAFGANGFYSDRFTNEWERTSVTLLAAQADVAREDLQFSVKSYWRHHKDDFVLDRARPEWFRNRHATDLYGVEATAVVSSRLGATAVGGEVAREAIRSESLGDRSRVRGGLFFEHRAKVTRRAALVPGASAYWYPGWGWAIQPGLDVGLDLGGGAGIHASVGHSFRVPTYTELYYSSPANVGNPHLEPEEAWAYEVGFRWQKQTLRGSVALFERNGRHLIDWVRAEAADPWQVRNAAETDFGGVELAIEYDPQTRQGPAKAPRIRIGYDGLRATRTTERLESKYLLDHLNHRITLDVTQGLGNGLEQAWRLRYRERSGERGHLLLDARVSWTRNHAELFLEGTNLLNTEYADIGSIRMPGRWVMAGVRVRRPLPR